MTCPSASMRSLGWSPFFQGQIQADETASLAPRRVAAVHRSTIDLLGPSGSLRAATSPALPSEMLAVGDWVLVQGPNSTPMRVLQRKSLLQRRAAGTSRSAQLIAANLDTLFVVSSCNADFNAARLERYLVVARQAGITPVVVLTKADTCDDPFQYSDAVRAVAPDVTVECLDARDPAQMQGLLAWCGSGETVALVGSSGVGKSTLIGAFTGQRLVTRSIREDDAKGRHTTTARCMYPMSTGAWLIDTPGMRALRLYDASEGVARVFHDITDLAATCRFADCRHGDEPGCSVQTAIASGDLDPDRVDRWHKLQREEARNTASVGERRRQSKALGKLYKSIKAGTKTLKGR